jgi:hypothetical protein
MSEVRGEVVEEEVEDAEREVRQPADLATVRAEAAAVHAVATATRR